jgi:hypothetical protein
MLRSMSSSRSFGMLYFLSEAFFAALLSQHHGKEADAVGWHALPSGLC